MQSHFLALSHLRRRHNFHRFRDLSDILNGFYSIFDFNY